MFLSGCDGCCRSRYNRHIYADYEWVELLNDKIAEAYADGSKNAVIDMNKLRCIDSILHFALSQAVMYHY